MDELRTRHRGEGVKTLLVTAFGKTWSADGFTAGFIAERKRLGLPDKHFHDARGTYTTELCDAGLTDQQITGIMGWTKANVAAIRRVYVDQARTVLTIGERLANAAVNRAVNCERGG